MKRKLLLFIVIASLCIFSLIGSFDANVEATDGFPMHNVDTGMNHATIQAAIDALQARALRFFEDPFSIHLKCRDL